MILEKLFSEKRATSGLKTPASWLSEALSATSNHSGVSVNESSAMQLSAVAAAVNVISNTIAAQAVKPYSRKNDVITVQQNHPVYKLLTMRPNDHMSAFVFFQLLQSHALRWGNGYAVIDFTAMGKTAKLWPLSPDKTDILTEDGDVFIRSIINGKPFTFAYEQVVHIKALGSDGLVGKSPIKQHAEELGIQIAAQNFGAEFFGNGATVQGVIQHPGKLGEEARRAIKDSWSSAFSGTGNRHKTPVLPDGMTYNRIGIPPEEAQFLETRRYGDTKIAQIFGIPPHMIGDLSKSSFNNITEETMNFVRRTINPWFIQWEQELNYKLFSDNEQRRLFVKFDKADILRGTPKDEADKDVAMINGGIISRNEARAARSLNPIEGLDEILVPLNMVEMSQATAAQNGEPLEEPEQNSFNVDPLIKRFAEQLTNAESKLSSKNSMDNWKTGVAQKFIKRHLEPVALALNSDDMVQRFIVQYSQAIEQDIINDEQIIVNTVTELAK